ncbi:MAG: hypothetical protein IJT65_03160 [Eubacterium sp.]|nr:hypothetical protein [Eubacterium sp.]
MKAFKSEGFKKTIIAISFNLVLAAIIISVFGIYYSSNDDDYIVAKFVSGGSPGLVFLNYFLMKALVSIGKLIYPINAHVVCHLVLSIMAFTAVTRVFLDKFKIDTALSISFLVVCLFAAEHYTSVSFTMVPALLSSAGFLCIIHFIKGRHPFGVCFGMLFVLLGSLYRFNSFIPSAVFAGAFVFITSLYDSSKSFKAADFFKRLFEPKRAVALFTTLVLCCSFYVASNTVYAVNPELKYYKEYNTARSLVWDYDIPRFEELEKDYRALGVDKNDLDMLADGFIDDEGAFSLDTLKQMRLNADKYYSAHSNAAQIMKKSISADLQNFTTLSDKSVIVIEAAVIFIIYIVLNKKQKVILPLTFAGLAAAFYVYLWYYRRFPFRAEYVIWTSPIFFLLYSLDYKDVRARFKNVITNKKRIVVSLSLITATACMLLTYSQLAVLDIKDMADTRYKLSEYISEHPENKYELDLTIDLFENNFKEKSIFTNKRIESEQDFLLISCSYFSNPYYKQCCKKIIGSENLYSSLLKDDVYFVHREIKGKAEPAERIRQYLEKHYAGEKNVKYRIVKKIDTVKIYKFYT